MRLSARNFPALSIIINLIQAYLITTKIKNQWVKIAKNRIKYFDKIRGFCW